MFKVVHHVRRGGVRGEVFLAKFACRRLLVVLLLFNMIPYFRRLSRHGWLLNVNFLTAMSKGPAVLKKKHPHDFLYLALQIKSPPAFYRQASRQSRRFWFNFDKTRLQMFFVFFSLRPIDQWNFGRLMSFWSTSIHTSEWWYSVEFIDLLSQLTSS